MRPTPPLLALVPPLLVACVGAAACGAAQGGRLTPEALRPDPALALAPGLVAAPSQEPILVPGSWAAPVRARIEAVIRAHGRPDLPLQERPLAVLDFEGTCVRNELGEALLVAAIERRALVVGESLFASVPPELGLEELRRHAARVAELPPDTSPAELERSPAFVAWRAGLVRVYRELRAREGGAAGAAWLATTLAGLTARDVRALAQEALTAELRRPLARRTLATAADGSVALARAAGIRYPDEMRDLVAALQRHGFDVWVVSATNQWTVEVGVQPLGIAPHHVVGARLAADPDGRLLPEIVPPLPWGPGKVAAVRTFIGRPPTLVIGDGAADRELLGTATALAVLIEGGRPVSDAPPDQAPPETAGGPGDAPQDDLRALAAEEGWAVQPAFAVAP